MDRARVISTARWRTAADAAAAGSDSRTAAFAAQIAECGTPTPGIYRTVGDDTNGVPT